MDNGPVTWADDDNQYLVWGEGGGFGGTNSIGGSSIGVARIEENWYNYKTSNVWDGFDTENEHDVIEHDVIGKSYCIVCVNSVLYMWVGMLNAKEDQFKEVKIAHSKDHGASWQFTD